MRYKMEIEYDGTKFSGWQLQKNAVTIQGNIEEALNRLIGKEVRIFGAGRTDAGVHARGQVAHFDLENNSQNINELKKGLNALTDRAIAIKDLRVAEDDFHSRYSATSRLYRYYICQNYIAIGADYYWINLIQLNDTDIKEFCEFVKKQTDFESFCKANSGVDNYFCDIHHINWIEKPGGIKIFEIQADRFLYGMVRALTGALMQVGKGQLNLDDIEKIFNGKDRRLAPMSAPAKGLVLEKVIYN